MKSLHKENVAKIKNFWRKLLRVWAMPMTPCPKGYTPIGHCKGHTVDIFPGPEAYCPLRVGSYIEGYGTVVGALELRMYFRLLDMRAERFTGKEVVYPPADIPRASIRKVAPPGVMAWSRMIESKRIDKSFGKDVVYSFSLFFCESMFALVRFWVGKIVRRMGHIEVSADNDRFFCFKTFQELKECGVPEFVAKLEPAEIRLCIGGVDGNNEKILEFCRYDATFVIRVAVAVSLEFVPFHEVLRQIKYKAFGFHFREYGGTAVSLPVLRGDRKSTRLNSSHTSISH